MKLRYIDTLLMAAGVALIDFAVKGTVVWNSLPSFMQGMTWHATIFLLYFAVVMAYVHAKNNERAGWAIVGIINEDFIYWLIRWAYYGQWKFNPPYLDAVQYAVLMVWANVLLVYFFVYRR